MSTANYVLQDGPEPSTLLNTVALIATSAIALYVAAILRIAFSGPLSHFPGPRLRAISKLPGIYTSIKGREAITRVALHDKYGPIVRVNPNELSFNGGAEAWAAIYGSRKQDDRPHKDPMFYVVGVNGVPDLSSADFATHTRQRKILSQSFSDRSIRDFEPIIRSWAEKMITKLSSKAGTPIDMMIYLNCTTFDIMGDLTFGDDLKMLDDGELSHWIKTIFGGFKAGTFWRGIRQLSTLRDWTVRKVLFGSKKVRLMQWENFQYCSNRVDARLAQTPDHPDLWSRLAKTGGTEGLSHDEYHSNSVLFMVAGSETTATALSGTTYLLHLPKNKMMLERLRAEVRDSFTSIQDMTFENLARLKYMQAVIQESLRIYPPAPSPLPRKTQPGGTVICGNFVPGGTALGVSPLATFHSPTHFKEPKEFRPERWLDDARYRNDHLDAVEPFSVGPQNCLGKNLAYHEMRFLLASLVLHFDIALLKPTEDWLDQQTHILWEKKPLMCVLRDRDSEVLVSCPTGQAIWLYSLIISMSANQ